mmetsp:Transcript_2134/g.4160  ORF Transcript_2134/g.4160 Transcript_2134/m.4160 type:complete len:385 (-) Transcript_2134:1308-2462(-)
MDEKNTRPHLVWSQVVPHHHDEAPPLDKYVGTLSGITFSDNYQKLLGVGDQGDLFFFNMEEESLKPTAVVALQPLPGEEAPDTESITARCTANETLVCPQASLLLWVGAEKRTNTTSGIFEYSLEGTMINRNPIPEKLFELTSTDNANQQVNLGFEAMAVSPDQKFILFITEGAVLPDKDIDSTIRRLVVYKLESSDTYVYRYNTRVDKSGISELACLSKDCSLFAMIERAYYDELDKNDVRVYRFSSDTSSPLKFNLNSTTLQARDVTKWVHNRTEYLEPLFGRSFVNINSFGSLRDNYEGMCLNFDKNHLLLVTDNNDNVEQRTIFASFELDSLNLPLLSLWMFFVGVLLLLFIVRPLCVKVEVKEEEEVNRTSFLPDDDEV